MYPTLLLSFNKSFLTRQYFLFRIKPYHHQAFWWWMIQLPK
jgi:hypothetical protein